MPVEPRLGGEPRTGVAGIHNEATKKATGSKTDIPTKPKDTKKQAEDAEKVAGTVPVVDSQYERGSEDESVPASGTQEKRKVTVPEKGSEGIFKTEVEQREAFKELSRTRNERNPDKINSVYDAKYFDLVNDALRRLQHEAAVLRQSVSVDIADPVFQDSNIAPQDYIDLADELDSFVEKQYKRFGKGNWESPEAQVAKVNPKDRYDRNVVE